MGQFGNLYSQYYDLLYQDKDYLAETNYVDNLIQEFGRCNSKTMLDLGCGTGKHAELFCDQGYKVHGVDLSEEMLKEAEKRRQSKEDKLSFSLSNISNLALSEKFDVLVSLFHVVSYQNSNKDLIKTFEVARDHLNRGGVFIFDFWYGPAVLTDIPSVRLKRLENSSIKVTRFAEPAFYPQKNTVDVNYDIFIENKKGGTTRKQEVHKMRYLFDSELEMICDSVGFSIESKCEWMGNKTPDFNSWNVVWVIRKI